MKQILFLLILFFLLGCDKDDDLTPQEQLPELTNVGANTFGCLVNGDIFLPQGGGIRSNRSSYYQFVGGFFTFHVSANNSNSDLGIAINLKLENFEDLDVGSYDLQTFEFGQGVGRYQAFIDSYDTDVINNGVINITYFDYSDRIVSGTFEFDVLAEDELIEIRDGRFDMRFTI